MKELIPEILVEINGKYFETIDISLDKPACMNCHKLIKDIPLRMWTKKEKRELHFCLECAKKLGILMG